MTKKQSHKKSLRGQPKKKQKVKYKSVEINKTETQLGIIAENFPNGSISLVDRKLKFIYTGGSGYGEFNIDPKKFIGQPVQKTLSPKSFTVLKKFLPRVWKGETVSHKIKFKDRYFKNTYKPIPNTKGKISSFVLISQDITEEETLIRERQRLYNVVNQSLNEVYIFDSKTLLFEYVNDVALNNLGYELFEMQLMTPLNIKPDLDWLSFNSFAQELSNAKKEKIVFETIQLRKDKSTYPVEVHLQLIKEGTKRKFFAIVLDITHRVKSMVFLERANQDLSASLEELQSSEEEMTNMLEEIRSSEEELRTQNGQLLKTQSDLKESEEMLNNVANNIPGLVMRYMVKPDGTDQIIFVSKGAEALWEVPHDEIIRDVNKIWAKVHPDDLQKFVQSVKESTANLSTWHYEYRAVMNDGRVKWISAVGTPSKLEDGSVLWHTIALDTTVLRRTQKQLEDSDVKYFTLIDNANTGIIVFKNDTTIILANSMASTILELSQDQMLGLTARSPNWNFIDMNGNSLPFDDYPVNKIIRNKAVLKDYIIGVINDPTKKPKWVNCNGTPVFDELNNLEQIIIIFNDVTARIEAETELFRTKLLLEETNQIAGIGRWEILLENNQLEWSEVARNIVHASANQTLTLEQAINLFEEGESRDTIKVLVEKAIKNGENYQAELLVRTLDGEQKWVKTYGISEMKDGVCVRFYGVIQDITDRKVNETETNRLVDELQKAIKEKDALFKELHHRIKNNLQMIISLLYVRSLSTTDKEILTFIKETKSRIHSISLLHEQLLQIQGISRLNIKPYLKTLIDNILVSFSNKESYTLNAEIENIYLPIDIVVNLGLITNEIVSNIVKYAYPDGQGGTVQVSLQQLESNLQLQISDRGIGIPSEKLGNTNLSYGMQLIKLFAEQIKGKLVIKVDQGTQYQLTIPIND